MCFKTINYLRLIILTSCISYFYSFNCDHGQRSSRFSFDYVYDKMYQCNSTTVFLHLLSLRRSILLHMKEETNKNKFGIFHSSFNAAAAAMSGYVLSNLFFADPSLSLKRSSWMEALLPPNTHAMVSIAPQQSLPAAEEQIIRLFEQSTPSVSNSSFLFLRVFDNILIRR